MALVRFCVPLDYRLFGKLRIDLALMVIEVPFSILGLVTHIYRLVNRDQGFNTQSGTNTAISGFSFVISLCWTSYTACGTFILPVIFWNNYYRRRAVIKSDSRSS
jgi:hypothetical protein